MHWKPEQNQGTRVVLVRHGQSTYNALGLYQGCSDESILTEKGRSAASKTGAYLKGLTFDAVYSSPLRRAQQTAREILKAMSPTADLKTICVSDLLKETDLRIWEGLAFQYVHERFGHEYRTWKQRPHEFFMELPHSPSYFYPALDLYERVRQFWQEVLSRHVGQTVLLVAHGGTNRALIHTAIGVSPDRYHCIQQSNCGISILDFPDGSLESSQLVGVNLTSHIEEDLPKLQKSDQGLRLMLLPSQSTSVERIQHLVQLLKGVGIDFSVNAETDKYQALVSVGANDEQLSTGLVVGCDRIIKYFINQALSLNPEQLRRLQLHPETISFLHYPESQGIPILQAMNVSIADKDLLFKLLDNKNVIPTPS
ncbi:histidine phosphatase family protein [Scytonema sp. UIC 10036]|uniref:histidine phosphatase family protein n=1 Tax=Scytonema sp. UIC 10036 TaxID=2304196 RepID=UPI0012DABAB7|nr:histidine phosphatase family protein [Scytonema sp. UIC 10036]MUG96377.1 histidine phosphatase family protein [Scytonema sp. UIC 10036]